MTTTVGNTSLPVTDEDVQIVGWTKSNDLDFTPDAVDTTLGGPQDAFFLHLNLISPSEAAYSLTYLGGGGLDQANGVASDAEAQTYVYGTTVSNDFPTANAIDTTLSGSTDAFVTEFSRCLDCFILASTYLGGSGVEQSTAGIGIDPAAQLYVTGYTESPDFPLTGNAVDQTFGGGSEGYVAKLSTIPFIDGSPLNISVSPNGHLSVSIDGEAGLEVDVDSNGAKAGLTIGFTGGVTQGVFGAGGHVFYPVREPSVNVSGNTFTLTTGYVASDSPLTEAFPDAMITETTPTSTAQLVHQRTTSSTTSMRRVALPRHRRRRPEYRSRGPGRG